MSARDRRAREPRVQAIDIAGRVPPHNLDAEAAVLSALKGSYTLNKLSLGDHTVCIKVVDKERAPTGAEKCIKVTAAHPGMHTY